MKIDSQLVHESPQRTGNTANAEHAAVNRRQHRRWNNAGERRQTRTPRKRPNLARPARRHGRRRNKAGVKAATANSDAHSAPPRRLRPQPTVNKNRLSRPMNPNPEHTQKTNGKGGVMILVRNDIGYARLHGGNEDGADVATCSVLPSANIAFTACSVYIPPGSAQRRNEDRDDSQFLSRLTVRGRVLIGGDLNGHGSWDANMDDDQQGHRIEEWATLHGITICNVIEHTMTCPSSVKRSARTSRWPPTSSPRRSARAGGQAPTAGATTCPSSSASREAS